MEVLEDDPDVPAPPPGESVVGQLVDADTVDDERPRSRPVDAGEQGAERRLAGSGRPDDGDELAAADREVDAVDAELCGRPLAPAASEVGGLDERRVDDGRADAGAVESIRSGAGNVSSMSSIVRLRAGSDHGAPRRIDGGVLPTITAMSEATAYGTSLIATRSNPPR